MVYGARRFIKRFGKNKRNNRILSTKRIFNNKGAKSQANQIFQLRKRIAAVSKKCSPEVKVIESETQNRGFADASISGTDRYLIYKFPVPTYSLNSINGSITDNDHRIGDKVTMLNSNVFISMQYEEIYNSMFSGFSTVKIPLTSSSIQARIVFIQSKVANELTPTLEDIFDQNGYLSGNSIDMQMMMKMPFVTGITTKYNILNDNVYNISHDKGMMSIRKTVKPAFKNLRWFKDQFDTNTNPPSGQIYMIVLTSGFSQHSYDSGEDTIYDYNKLNFTFRVRTPYTDA